MIRKLFSPGHTTKVGSARKRDFEIQRIETFSDGVFAKSKRLGFTAVEKFDCKSNMYKEIIMISTGLCSLLFAQLLTDREAGISSMIYMLLLPAITIFYAIRKRIRRKLFPKGLEDI